MAAIEQSFPAGAEIAIGGGRVITSPFQFVADADTFLRVISVCSAPGVTLAIQGRRLDAHGQIQPITETHAPLETRTTLRQDYVLGVGPILNLTVFAAAGAPLIGQCYVMVQLLRNMGATAIVLGTLLGGYVTTVQALGFPGSPVVSSTDGEPVVRNIVGTTPAPGAACNEACPTGARWEVVTVFTRLTTSAAVGARTVFFDALYGGVTGVVSSLPASADQPAGVTWVYSFGQNLPLSVNGGVVAGSLLQRQFLRGGDGFTINAFALDAGDSFTGPIYQVREWLEGG